MNGSRIGRLVLQASLAALAVATLPIAARSQRPEPARKIAHATPTDAKITLDGKLDEPAWQTAELIAGFLQQDPKEGNPPSGETEIRILYDQNYLYVGAVCHDEAPRKIVVNDISRDFETTEEDYVAVLLDTFNDRRSGYYLATTAEGGEKDSQFIDEGRANNINWDGVWFVESHRNEIGYTAEFAIPFKTLRFSKDRQQVWGLQMIRRNRRHAEANYWSLPPRRYSSTRSISYAGELHGLENVEPGRNLQVKPYALAGISELNSRGEGRRGVGLGALLDEPDATDWSGDGVGFDLKYGVTPGLSLDFTLNTDFSHVEADTQQVNLTRFPTFFPEKREFFLENAGIFSFGATARNEALLFHSRTIGLQGGQPVPILGGARLSGHAGRNYLGLLNMETRTGDWEPETNFTAARIRRDILGTSNVGAIFLNRQPGLAGDSNRAFGVDANLVLLRTDLRISPVIARTITPGREGDDRLYRMEGEYQNNLVRYLGSYVGSGKNFRPEMGFVRRPGRRIIHQEFELRPRFTPEMRFGSILRDVTVGITSEQALLSGGHPESKLLTPRLNIIFADASAFDVRYTQDFERVGSRFNLPFDVVVPAGDYRFNQFAVSYSSDHSKPLAGNLGYLRGDFYNGTTSQWTTGFRVRLGYRLSASVDFERDKVKLPQGSFHSDLVGVHVEYTLNAKMFLNAFIQYNNEADQLSTNLRYRFIHRPLSDVYLVYNDIRNRSSANSDKTDWSLTLKYTRLLSF